MRFSLSYSATQQVLPLGNDLCSYRQQKGSYRKVLKFHLLKTQTFLTSFPNKKTQKNKNKPHARAGTSWASLDILT